MRFINRFRIFSIVCFAFLPLVSSCSHKTPLQPASLVRGGRFSFFQDKDGRWFIVTMDTKDLEAAMKKIQPGPASIDKLNLWIVTPLGKPPAN
jgi:hypothetical protein